VCATQRPESFKHEEKAPAELADMTLNTEIAIVVESKASKCE
jgi:hypothetical protein